MEVKQSTLTQAAKMEKGAEKISLKKFYVTNGVKKARVSYSRGKLIDGRECVTLYAKDYSNNLADVFGAENYQNDTDSMTDYFEKGRVRIFPGDALFEAACERAAK